jgi:ribosomal protein L13
MTVQCTQNDLNKTLYIQKKVSDASKKWLQIDATNLHFGRLAVVIANALQGKGKVSYNDFWDQ